jgi:uncharacterized membrane protein
VIVTLELLELVSIVLAALVAGVFWGPWVALTRSVATLSPDTFLAVGHRMNENLEPLMTVLMPLSLASTIAVLVLSYGDHPQTFGFTLAGLAAFLVALAVTIVIEVPIAKQIKAWALASTVPASLASPGLPVLPDNWEQLRDRWASVHIVRVVSGIAGLTFLTAGAIFG